MNDQLSAWQLSTTRRFLKWLFSWRTIRRAVIGLVCLVTLWALFCTEENIRGRRTWEKYRREAEARGEQLDFNAFVPKPVPDDQNFAAIPLIKSWFVKGTFEDNRKRWDDTYRRAEERIKTDKTQRSLVDLDAWARALSDTNSHQVFAAGSLDRETRAKAAPVVLESLKASEPIFVELRAASERPYSRYPVNYNLEDPFSILLPHLANVRDMCRRLQLKACAELAAGQTGAAMDDVKLIFQMADSLREEPFLISCLVRIACLQHAVQPIWEGLAEHRWSDAQLQQLQTKLQQYNLIAYVRPCFDSERAAGAVVAELIRKRGLAYLVDIGGPGQPTPSDRTLANLAGIVVPSGWLYLEQYNSCHSYDQLMDGTMDAAMQRVYPSRSGANLREFERGIGGNKFAETFVHHRLLAALLLPALNNIISKTAAAQTVVDQAALACALERYRLVNGQFPEKLDALVPAFVSQLPHDVITGEPYKYRRTDDGWFVLYSIGWDQKDDNGVPGKKEFANKEGDWVWQYPAP